MIWLENTNPNDLIPALRPLMPQFAHMAAIAGTNALIVSDRAANIYQLENIIRNLDGLGKTILKRSIFSRAKQKKSSHNLKQ